MYCKILINSTGLQQGGLNIHCERLMTYVNENADPSFDLAGPARWTLTPQSSRYLTKASIAGGMAAISSRGSLFDKINPGRSSLRAASPPSCRCSSRCRGRSLRLPTVETAPRPHPRIDHDHRRKVRTARRSAGPADLSTKARMATATMTATILV